MVINTRCFYKKISFGLHYFFFFQERREEDFVYALFLNECSDWYNFFYLRTIDL